MKKWFSTTFYGGSNEDIQEAIEKFLNNNNLSPGEIIVLGSHLFSVGAPSTIIMYYAKHKLK